MSSTLIDRRRIRSAIGRPRTALWVGGTEAASIAEERGAKVFAEDASAAGAPPSEGFDLVFVTATAAKGDLGAVLARVAPQLADGGHVVVHHGARGTLSSAIAAVRAVGLEPMWHDSGPLVPSSFANPELIVARRPPARRLLSMTVGMISMNEAGAVGGVIDDIRRHCPDAEVLLVDSSKDDTPEIAEDRGARVIRQFPPRGYGPAMTRLLYEATTDVIVTMDCDGTYPADRIPELHRRIEDGTDLVNASRTHHRPKTMPLSNYVANRTFAAFSNVMHGFYTTDVHSGMRAYRTSMLRGIFVEEQGPALPVELLIVPARRGYRVEEVDIDYFERIGDTTLRRFDSTVWTFRRIARAAGAGRSVIP